MSSAFETGCGWEGKIPKDGVSEQCQACQLMRTPGQVARCRIRGGPDTEPEVIEPKSKTTAPQVAPKPARQPKPESGIGDCLKAYFDSIGAKQSPGCPCKDVQAKLNKRSPEQVLKEIDNWVGDILENVKNLSGVTGLVASAAKYIAPNMLREKLKSEILRCLEESKAKLSQTAQDASKIDPEQNTTTVS